MHIINHPLFITIYRFITSYTRNAFQSIILPIMVLGLVPPELKGRELSKLLFVAYTFGIIGSVVTNSLSDKINTPFGRRKLLILVSSFLMSTGIIIFLQASDFIKLYISVITIYSGISIADSALNAIIPDVLARGKREKAAKYLTFYNFLGLALGPVIAGILVNKDLSIFSFSGLENIFSNKQHFLNGVVFIILILISTIITLYAVRETAVPDSKNDSKNDNTKDKGSIKNNIYNAAKNNIKRIIELYSYKKVKRFILFLLMRLFVCTTMSLPAFLYYYHKTIVRFGKPEMATSLTFLAFFVGTLIIFGQSKIIKKFNYLKSITFAIILIIISIPSFYVLVLIHPILIYLAALLYGAGWALWLSLTLSYATLILPHEGRSGLYMSFYLLSTFFGNTIGIYIAGHLFDYFNLFNKVYGFFAIGLFSSFCLVVSLLLMYFLSKD